MCVRSEMAIKRRMTAYKSDQCDERIRSGKFGCRNSAKLGKLNAKIEELEWVLGREEFV